MNNLTNTIKTAATAFVSFNAAKEIATSMTEAAGSMEAYRGTLNVVLKDHKKAAETMVWATKFANKTPFETDSIVEATVKLESYGLKAKNILPTVGDMASVMNKDIIQAVEAMADAQNGELERLKEFGITKDQIIEHGQKQLGMKNLVNQKGQINDQEKFNQVLLSLMESRFSGGMELQSNMYKGIMSTISGVWKSGLASMSGVTMSGEVADGSLFHMLKTNAKVVADLLTKFVEDGTFERAGKQVAGFFKYIGSGVNLAKAGMKKAWPHIKKTGALIRTMMGKSKKTIEKLIPSFDSVGKKVSWFKKAFIQGFFKTKVIVEKNLPKLKTFGRNILDLGSKVKRSLAGGFNVVKPIIKWVFTDGLPMVTEGIISVIGVATDLYGNFSNKWTLIEPIVTKIGDGLKSGLIKALNMAKPIIEWIITDGFSLMGGLLSGIIDGASALVGVIIDKWSFIEPIVVGITGVLVGYKLIMAAIGVATAISTGLTTGLTIATTALGAAIAFITSPIGLVIAGIAAVIAIGWAMYKNWDEITAWFSDQFTALGGWASAAGDSIKLGFKSAYDGVVATWNGLGDWFSSLWQSVGNIGKGYVNFYIKLMNFLIDGINKVSIDIPDWVPGIGGKNFGVSIPNIPFLAQGGITTGPTLAMIGEGSEQEAVLPLSKLSGLLKLAILRALKLKEKTVQDKNSFEKRFDRFNKITNIHNKSSQTVHYKQEINFYGNVNKDEVKQTVKEGGKEFKKNVLDPFDRHRRLSFR